MPWRSPISTVSDTGAPLTPRVSAALDEALAHETELAGQTLALDEFWPQSIRPNHHARAPTHPTRFAVWARS